MPSSVISPFSDAIVDRIGSDARAADEDGGREETAPMRVMIRAPRAKRFAAGLWILLSLFAGVQAWAETPAFDWSAYARRPFAAPAHETDARSFDLPRRRLSTRGYTHFSSMSATPDGNLHLFSYYGQQHQGGRESAVVHRVSSDHGVTWSVPRPILDGFRHGLDWRIGATGATSAGRLIVTAVRSDLASPTGAVLGAIHSDDGGRTWSAFAPLVQSPPSPFEGGRSQMLPFGQIKTTPSGRLLMMSNLGRFNFLLVSDDEGATWQRSVVIESETPDYSEMAVQPIDEDNWVAVSRIDREKSSMAQFVSRDAGRSWGLLGGLDMPVRGGYVAPTLNLVEGDDGPIVVLGLTDRTTGRAVLRTSRAADALISARRWSGPRYIADGLIVRSGYQTGVVDVACDRMVIADHREVSEFDTVLDVALVPLPEIVPSRLLPRHSSACPAF